MFTKNNTMNEILNTEPVGRAAGNLFPTCFMARVPVEHRDHTMAQIEKEETMEWGAPFLADAFLECANLIKETAETKKGKKRFFQSLSVLMKVQNTGCPS